MITQVKKNIFLIEDENRVGFSKILNPFGYALVMKQSVFDKNKCIPRYLVPKVKKRHAAALHGDADWWRLFAEGCLRNRYFHERIFKRGPKCLACDRAFNKEEAKVQSKIEKHHNCYLRECIGNLLPAGDDDIYRDAAEGEFDQVPDCQ